MARWIHRARAGPAARRRPTTTSRTPSSRPLSRHAALRLDEAQARPRGRRDTHRRVRPRARAGRRAASPRSKMAARAKATAAAAASRRDAQPPPPPPVVEPPASTRDGNSAERDGAVARAEDARGAKRVRDAQEEARGGGRREASGRDERAAPSVPAAARGEDGSASASASASASTRASAEREPDRGRPSASGGARTLASKKTPPESAPPRRRARLARRRRARRTSTSAGAARSGEPGEAGPSRFDGSLSLDHLEDSSIEVLLHELRKVEKALEEGEETQELLETAAALERAAKAGGAIEASARAIRRTLNMRVSYESNTFESRRSKITGMPPRSRGDRISHSRRSSPLLARINLPPSTASSRCSRTRPPSWTSSPPPRARVAPRRDVAPSRPRSTRGESVRRRRRRPRDRERQPSTSPRTPPRTRTDAPPSPRSRCPSSSSSSPRPGRLRRPRRPAPAEARRGAVETPPLLGGVALGRGTSYPADIVTARRRRRPSPPSSPRAWCRWCPRRGTA